MNYNHTIEEFLKDIDAKIAIASGETDDVMCAMLLTDPAFAVTELVNNSANQNVEYSKKNAKSALSTSDSAPKIDEPVAFPKHRQGSI